MTSPSTPQAQIDYLATKIMGWTKERWERTEHFCCGECGKCNESCKPQKGWSWRCEPVGALSMVGTMHTWNPLTDWGDWRQVEEAAMCDFKLWEKFAEAIAGRYEGSLSGFQAYAETSLESRVAALIAAHEELYGS